MGKAGKEGSAEVDLEGGNWRFSVAVAEEEALVAEKEAAAEEKEGEEEAEEEVFMPLGAKDE